MDRQVRRMVTQRTGEESNNVEAVEPVAAVVPSDSDEDKNDNVIYKRFLYLMQSFCYHGYFCFQKDGDSAKSLCLNCGINCSQLQATAKGALCSTCANHLKYIYIFL